MPAAIVGAVFLVTAPTTILTYTAPDLPTNQKIVYHAIFFFLCSILNNVGV